MRVNPAIVEAKVSMAFAEAGSEGGGFDMFFAPSPVDTKQTTRTGIQDVRSYLPKMRLNCLISK